MMMVNAMSLPAVLSICYVLIIGDVCHARPHDMVHAIVLDPHEDYKRNDDRRNSTAPFLPLNPRCKYESVCDISEISNYPREMSAEAIGKSRENANSALQANGVEQETQALRSGSPLRARPLFVSRVMRNVDADDEELCPSRETRLTPVAAKNVQNQWRYLVNNEHYGQIVIFYRCRTPGQRCHPEIELPPGQGTICRQMTTQLPLASLHPVSGDVMTDIFNIPSGCSCAIRNEVNLTTCSHVKHATTQM